MATYPNGVFAPASRSAGQKIGSAHMNDVQAEITAVEDALRNGIPHAVTISTGGLTVSTGSVNIGGPSSLATLNVSGGSTLAALHVTSTASFDSSVTVASMTVTGNLNIGGVFTQVTPAVRVTNSATKNVEASAWTGLSWDTHDHDNVNMHSTSANSSRITFAASSGIYLVGCSVEWPTNASNQRFVRIMVNDLVSAGAMVMSSITSVNLPMSLSAQVRAASTADYVTVQVFQNTASSMLLPANSTTFGTSFWAHRVA